uniref:PH domain-containing protein n=1 Tax=Glossina brevipalpis TaxID=37001 RepID=A0A1A9WQI6_9MUSC
MTNSKTRKTSKRTRNSAAGQRSEFNQEQIAMNASGRDELDTGSAWVSKDNNCTSPDLLDDDDDDDEDDDSGEIVHDDDTSTTFSLQECMDEFRARRINRISSQCRHTREGKEKFLGELDYGDLDLINENLTNKEQERKCKPCKDGFCYCFTSDSGDGGGRGTCQALRLPRRNRRQDLNQQVKTLSRRSSDEPRVSTKAKIPQKFESQPKVHESASRGNNAFFTATSHLEASGKDEPLIHIIQELRDNCVISKVRVNKHKVPGNHRSGSGRGAMLSTGNKGVNFISIEPSKTPRGTSHRAPLDPHTPTAPPLEKISEHETPGTVMSSLNGSIRQRHKAGGKLLKKRLSNSTQRSYKSHNIHEPPPKPPRSSLSLDDKSSAFTFTSTSSSVREAERVVDEFLAKRGYAYGNGNKEKESAEALRKKIVKPRQSRQTLVTKDCCANTPQSYPYPLNKKANTPKRLQPQYPSLSDIEQESKNYEEKDEHTSELEVRRTRDICIGWNEPKIKEMLNCDPNAYRKEFRSTATQAEPQQPLNGLKIDLDTVDGGVKRNLATNIESKGTPIKFHLLGSSHNPKKGSSSQKFIWSEQWRNLSPWLNKQNNNNKHNESARSNLSSGSKAFLKTSKQKILRLVSPKKENKERINMQIRKTPGRNVGVQTSPENSGRPNSLSQSPPGSYHSPADSIRNTTNSREPTARFNFDRVVHSPKKKTCFGHQSTIASDSKDGKVCQSHINQLKGRTYRSFNTDLDQDVTLSKMSYILSNIRAKLEASDQHAIRTFRELERRDIRYPVFDCTDSQRTCVQIHTDLPISRVQNFNLCNEPIYSEIEEDSIHVLGGPHFGNHTGVQKLNEKANPEDLYAKVNKNRPTSTTVVKSQPTALGKFLHESLNAAQLEPSTSERNLITRSLNNVSVREHNSPPKRTVYVSESDLSLCRSEIFLENLCKSELIVDGLCQQRLVKVENKKSNCNNQTALNDNGKADNSESVSMRSNSVSYESPNNDTYAENDVSDNSTATCSNLGISTIASPSSNNQSTPKKQKSFTTKDSTLRNEPDEDARQYARSELSCSQNVSHECARLDGQPDYTTRSLNNFSRSQSCSATSSPGKFIRYRRMKNVLQKSFRKSKHFVRTEARRLSMSFSFSGAKDTLPAQEDCRPETPQSVRTGCNSYSCESNLYLETLFSLDEAAPVAEQLAKAVSICRLVPELEISPEMVEAERLLLYSTLKFERRLFELKPPLGGDQVIMRFYIDEMFLQIRPNGNQDMFFNYFYIVTFECGGSVKSTQSVECQNSFVSFPDCGIEFTLCPTILQTRCIEEELTVHCNIFMLRLRKVSTLSLEPRRSPSKINASCASLSSSTNEIVSRFRLHASFSLNALDFAPYEYVPQESNNSERLCLRSSGSCSIPLIHQTTSNNLKADIQLRGRAELRYPKRTNSGFLNVEDPQKQHNWNRRWCTLNGLHMHVWQDENCIDKPALLSLDLLNTSQSFQLPLTVAYPESCARPRSFCLLYNINSQTNECAKKVFFSADNQEALATCKLVHTVVGQFKPIHTSRYDLLGNRYQFRLRKVSNYCWIQQWNEDF